MTVFDDPSGSAAGTLIASLKLAAPFCSTADSLLFLDFTNMIIAPMIRANPSTPPTTPPIIALLFVGFAPLLLAAVVVAEALYDPVEEDFRLGGSRGERCGGAGGSSEICNGCRELCPICPRKVVSVGRGI